MVKASSFVNPVSFFFAAVKQLCSFDVLSVILLKSIFLERHRLSISFFFPEQCHAPGSSTDVLNVALTLSALSFCVRERLKSWSICLTTICLVWPVSARNIRKWLVNWFLCIMGCRTRRRWSAKMSALLSALFHVESSLEVLSPLGAGCWYSYTHTLQHSKAVLGGLLEIACPDKTALFDKVAYYSSACLSLQKEQQQLKHTSGSISALCCCPYLHNRAGQGSFTSQRPHVPWGALVPTSSWYCGTFTGTKGTVRARFEPPNLLQSVVSFHIHCF